MVSLKLIPVAILLLIIIALASLSFATRQHRIKAQNDRQLSACPDKPNCVSSQADKKSQSVDYFPLKENNHILSWEKMNLAIKQAGGIILINDGHYGHAVFTSTLFRFKDDLEIILQQDKIDIRSASRAGRSDFGINRKRVEKIRSLYQ